MSTLLIELEGPMQSWGYRSRFSERDTGREPTKSGVIGLLAASFGRSREADISDLASLTFGVRVDREGVIKREFQTALDIVRADGGRTKQWEAQLTYRYYLSDARFIAGIEGDKSFLVEIMDAIKNPVFMHFLGRRSFVPSVPLLNTSFGPLTNDNLRTALTNYPYKGSIEKDLEETTIDLRLVRDAEDGEESASQDFRQDVPVSYSRKEYLMRKVITEWVKVPLRKEE